MLMRGTLSFACLALAAGLVCAEEEQRRVFTDPADAGPDFAVQGEYVGEIETDGEKRKLGVQVIALGDGRFDAVAYPGGLPGDGWTGEERRTVAGDTRDGATYFEGDDGSGVLRDGVITVRRGDGTALGSLKKVERESPTAGARPPEGALVLFDGTTAEHFEGGRMTEEGYLMVGCETKQKFGDHTLHVEFRTPFMPYARGQARGNSGVYIQNRYECQVLDSFGLEGLNNECGGIYQIAAPKVNMCFPPLSWQTYDIEFTAARYDDDGNKVENARVTIRHNGVLIHDDLELPRGTPGKNPEGPGPDGLYLQDHGDPVVFRNIWVVEKK